MKMKNWGKAVGLTLLAAVLAGLTACASGPATASIPGTTPSPSPVPTATVIYNQYQLEYRLLATYPDYFWCDPDFYPIVRIGQEQANAITQFPNIQANAAEFAAILEYLKLPVKAIYSDTEKLDIYREYKRLNDAIIISSSATNIYNYSLRTGQNQGWHIEGTISTTGQITITRKETSFNTCPICLARGTLINTPAGPIPVEQIQPGMSVWTRDGEGKRIAVPVLKTSSTAVPDNFRILKITLADGRTVTASPGHPSAELRPLGSYHVGDFLDSSRIISIESVTYTGGRTFDLLPEGQTGLYWAGGILLASTLGR